MNIIDEGTAYENLANAIINRAANDWIQARDNGERVEISRFFKSDYFSLLTDVDPDYLIKRMEGELMLYHYRGPVFRFERLINADWEAYTKAPTFRKAVSNLIYRYKLENGYKSTANISLLNKYLEEEDEN